MIIVFITSVSRCTNTDLGSCQAINVYVLEASKKCKTSLRFSALVQEWYRRLIYHSRTCSQGETRSSKKIHERDTGIHERDKSGMVGRRHECDVGWGQSDSEMKCKKLWAANWLVHELYFCFSLNLSWKMLCLLIAKVCK